MRILHRVLSIIAVGLVVSAPLFAQEITYTTKTSMEMGGTLGDLMRLVPGVGGDEEETVMISVASKTMRTDRDDRSTIVNYTTGDITSVDHDEKTWMTMNFGQMMEGMANARSTVEMPPDYQAPQTQEAEVAYEARFSVDRTGETKEILGYRTELTILRIDLVPVRAPEGRSLDEMPTHVMLTAMWLADDFPGNEAMQALAGELGEQMMGEQMQGMAQAFASNSALQTAFEKNAEELAKMDGMPLEQLTSFTSIPPGVEFDMDEALGGDLAESGTGIDLGGAALSGLGQALNQAAGGRLGGLLGRRSRQAEPEAPEPKQFVLMRLREAVVAYDEGGHPAGWDLVPDGYREQESPFPIRD